MQFKKFQSIDNIKFVHIYKNTKKNIFYFILFSNVVLSPNPNSCQQNLISLYKDTSFCNFLFSHLLIAQDFLLMKKNNIFIFKKISK